MQKRTKTIETLETENRRLRRRLREAKRFVEQRLELSDEIITDVLNERNAWKKAAGELVESNNEAYEMLGAWQRGYIDARDALWQLAAYWQDVDNALNSGDETRFAEEVGRYASKCYRVINRIPVMLNLEPFGILPAESEANDGD